LVADAEKGMIDAIWLAGGYPPECGDWLTKKDRAAIGKCGLVILQDLFADRSGNVAHYMLPATTFAEKNGTYVNHAQLAQCLLRAVRPPHEVRCEGQIALDFLNRKGLYVAADVRREMALELPYFAPLSDGISELGKKLGTS
jgi:NADH-quinone oxidoreductase subunit G